MYFLVKGDSELKYSYLNDNFSIFSSRMPCWHETEDKI